MALEIQTWYFQSSTTARFSCLVDSSRISWLAFVEKTLFYWSVIIWTNFWTYEFSNSINISITLKRLILVHLSDSEFTGFLCQNIGLFLWFFRPNIRVYFLCSFTYFKMFLFLSETAGKWPPLFLIVKVVKINIAAYQEVKYKCVI